jgi:hypothetical protein
MTKSVWMRRTVRVAPAARPDGMRLGRKILFGQGVGREQKLRLSARLRRVLTDHPRARHFTVSRIIESLKAESAEASLALFSAASVLDTPSAKHLSGPFAALVGAGLAIGKRSITIPRRLLRKKIPRNALSILVQGICSILDASRDATRERWNWVFHPAMGAVLGLTLFLVAIASMVPVIGGGAQHAASAFLIAVGLAERDGLAVVIGAIVGIACVALAAFSVASSSRLWKTIKSWLMRCARRLHLTALAALLDRCSHGLGELVRLKWGGLLLLILTPSDPLSPRRSLSQPESRLRKRALSAFVRARRATPQASPA